MPNIWVCLYLCTFSANKIKSRQIIPEKTFADQKDLHFIFQKLDFQSTRRFKGVNSSFLRRFSLQRNFCQSGPFSWRVDSAMHWINHTEVDNSIGVDSAYPVNSDLCGRTEIDHIIIPI